MAWLITLALVISLSPGPVLADDGRGNSPGRAIPIGLGEGIPITPFAQEYDPGGGSSESATVPIPSGTCTNQSRDPHSSDHIRGNINAEGWTGFCTYPVVLSVHAKLYKEFGWLWWWTLDEQWGGPVTSTTVNVFVNSSCNGDLWYRIFTEHWTESASPNPALTRNDKYVPCQSAP
jgi:hypothetical protein